MKLLTLQGASLLKDKMLFCTDDAGFAVLNKGCPKA